MNADFQHARGFPAVWTCSKNSQSRPPNPLKTEFAKHRSSR